MLKQTFTLKNKKTGINAYYFTTNDDGWITSGTGNKDRIQFQCLSGKPFTMSL